MGKSLQSFMTVEYMSSLIMSNGHGGHLVFQNEAKSSPRQAFVLIDISCKFDKNTLGSRRVTGKSLLSAGAY